MERCRWESSDRLQVHHAGVTNFVDRLVASGYVEREPDDRVRRTVLARITQAGTSAARDATEQLNATRFGMNPLDDAACEGIYSLFRWMRLEAADFIGEPKPYRYAQTGEGAQPAQQG